MPINPISFANTPQATTDIFLASSTGLTEDSVNVVILDVMANDLGGAAKSLYSLDNGISTGDAAPTDLLGQDTARAEALSTDTSLAGARIWITSDGKVGYDTASLSQSFLDQLQALNPGDYLTDSFTYAIRMGNGTLSWATATVQFAGRNDAPTVSGTVSGSAAEDGSVQTLDALANAHDVDSNAVLQVVGVPSTLPAGVTYDAATHSFSLDPSDAAYQHLAAGQTLAVVVQYGVSDGTATTPATVTFNLTGVNDAATIGAPTATAVTEDAGVSAGKLSVSGTIGVTDVDDGEAAFHTTVTPAAGTLGTLALAGDGSYTYSVANADVQFLGAGETQTDKFTVTSIDGTSKEVSFTITGVNDAAVIGAPTVAAVTEDSDVGGGGNLSAAGSISISDADQNQSTFQTAVTGAAGNLGSLNLAADGNYTYSVANAGVQYLGEGETKTDKFTVSSFDGTTKEVSFTITGVNDAAVIGDPTSAAVTEDVNVSGGNLSASGSISISDADQNQSTFQTAVTGASANLGTLNLAANGDYTYSVANSGVQFLGAGETQTDRFTVASFDGTTKDVSFTITGVNDAAVIGGPSAAAVTEDLDVSGGNLSATGSISISDADQNQSFFQTSVSSAAGNLGSLDLAAGGGYTYTVANASVQFLRAGQTQVDKFTVSALDGTSKEIGFTVNGANDAAVIGDPTAATVTEDTAVSGGNLSATGSISISDADQGEGSFLTTVTGPSGNLGSLTLAANGSYAYTVANADVQFLGASESRTDTFTVSALDGTTKAVSFTIQGANDAAVIGNPSVSSVTEDLNVSGTGQLTAAGTISVTDADQGQASFQTTVSGASGNLGSLVLAANGSYTYSVANASVQYLGGADSKVDQFTVTTVDGTSKQVSFTIQGANDTATIGAPTVSTVTEDVAVTNGQLSAAGTIPITDADQNQSAFQTTVTAGTGALGSLVLDANGSYVYSVANAATQSLGGTDVHTDSFTVTALDGTTRTVSFTIQGTNDVAVITGVTSASVLEDSGVVNGQLVTGPNQLTATDADAGQSGFQAQASTAGTYGTFSLTASGAWTYSVSNSLAAVQNLNAGQSLTDGFTATSTDGSASTPVTVTIQGVNDGLVGTDKADTYTFQASGSGSQTISDPGGNDVIVFTGSAPLTVLGFEQLGNDLQLQVNSQVVTVQNHFAGAGGAVEQVTFSAGQTFAGYALAGTYALFSGTDFTGGNGSSNDVIAGTSVGQTLDGGGGASGRDLLFGNGGDDTLVGQNNNDLLVAGAGNDILQGGDGNDVLVGGAGNDVFVFNTALSASGNVDRIADFDGNGDLVQLAKAGLFANLATPAGATLQAADFFSGAGAASASVGAAHVIYDTTTGNLYYDANGGAGDQRTLFATLDPAGVTGAVTAADFRVV